MEIKIGKTTAAFALVAVTTVVGVGSYKVGSNLGYAKGYASAVAHGEVVGQAIDNIAEKMPSPIDATKEKIADIKNTYADKKAAKLSAELANRIADIENNGIPDLEIPGGSTFYVPEEPSKFAQFRKKASSFTDSLSK